MKKEKTLCDLIRSGTYEEVKKALLSASHEQVNAYGQTPLMVAIHSSYRKEGEAIFDLVLNWENDVNRKDIDGYTAFSHAVSLRKGAYMEKLLHKDIDVNVPCIVTVAPHPRAYEAFERSVSSDKSVPYPISTKQIMSPLCAVIYKSYDYLITDIVDKGADLDAVGGLDITALSMAIRSDKLDVVKYLLDRGANPNVLPSNWKEYSEKQEEICPVALKKALKYGCSAALVMLVDAGVKIPEVFLRKENVYSTPLTYLFSQPKKQIDDPFLSLRVLKDYTDIAKLDSLNRSALSYAIENEYRSYILPYLMDEKINNQMDCFLKTPMIYAYENRHFKAMDLLYGAGVAIAEHVDQRNGLPLLINSAIKGDNEMISFMLEYNPNLLQKDRNGKDIMNYLSSVDKGLATKITEAYQTQLKKQKDRLFQNEK